MKLSKQSLPDLLDYGMRIGILCQWSFVVISRHCRFWWKIHSTERFPFENARLDTDESTPTFSHVRFNAPATTDQEMRRKYIRRMRLMPVRLVFWVWIPMSLYSGPRYDVWCKVYRNRTCCIKKIENTVHVLATADYQLQHFWCRCKWLLHI